MSPSDKLPPSMLIALGLTSVITTAVECGPCLKYAGDTPPEEQDTGDTGEPEDACAPGDRQAATQRVLARGVLPEDIAALLASRSADRT